VSTLHPGRAAGEEGGRLAQVAFLQPPQAVKVEVLVVYRVENIAVGYTIRLVTREQLLEVVLVVYREENIAVGHKIRLATLEQLLWLWWIHASSSTG
jgi:hypothetical protein